MLPGSVTLKVSYAAASDLTNRLQQLSGEYNLSVRLIREDEQRWKMTAIMLWHMTPSSRVRFSLGFS